jgi:hypothetical protein
LLYEADVGQHLPLARSPAHKSARSQCAVALSALGKRQGARLEVAEAKVRRLQALPTSRLQLATAAAEVGSARAAELAAWEAELAGEEQRLAERQQALLAVRGHGS